ncbi:MAG: 1-phosphofructokinase family hexose kinase [Erysipelotrichaceae bacterium]|jgi:1-phosphofructokinase
MIITVTLNPAIDYYVYVTNLSSSKTNIIEKKEIRCGGKGINVNKTLSFLKEKSVATGFLFSNDVVLFEKELNNEYIIGDFVIVEGSTRTNIKINQQDGSLIEINENNKVKETDFFRLLSRLEKYLIKENIIVISGSLPEGLSKDTYLKLCLRAKEKGCKVIFDSSKKPMMLAYRYCDVIKPNKEEFLYLTGLDDECSMQNVVDKLREFDNEIAVVSLAEQGAIYKYKNDIYKVNPLNMKVKSTVGAGDAMVAGLSYGLKNRKDFEEIIRYASALSSLLITDFDQNNFENELETFKKMIEIERI